MTNPEVFFFLRKKKYERFHFSNFNVIGEFQFENIEQKNMFFDISFLACVFSLDPKSSEGLQNLALCIFIARLVEQEFKISTTCLIISLVCSFGCFAMNPYLPNMDGTFRSPWQFLLYYCILYFCFLMVVQQPTSPRLIASAIFDTIFFTLHLYFCPKDSSFLIPPIFFCVLSWRFACSNVYLFMYAFSTAIKSLLFFTVANFVLEVVFTWE